MKTLIICSDISERIKEVYKTIHKTSEEGYNVFVIGDGVMTNESYDEFIIEWSCREHVIKHYQQKLYEKKIYFFNELFYVDIDNRQLINSKIEDALHNEDWQSVKAFNEFKIYANVIRKKTEIDSFPSKIQIETTDLCNAKCIMCSHAYSSGSGIDILDSGLIDRIKQLLPYVKVAVLHGNGEPFLKKNLTTYLKELSSFGIKFIANTNMSIVNEEILEFLKKDFIELNVSCDGHNKELYETIRQGLSFEKFVANVRIVRKYCPNLSLKMSVVVMRQNLPYLQQIVDFAYGLGFDEIIFNQLCIDEKNNNISDDPCLYKDLYVNALQEVKEAGLNKKIVVRYPQIDELNSTAENVIDDNRTTTFSGVCDWLLDSPFINLQGDVAICCINQKKIVGNVFQDKFLDIWNSDEYQKYRSNFYSGYLRDFCIGCDFITQNRLVFLKMNHLNISSMKKMERVR